MLLDLLVMVAVTSWKRMKQLTASLLFTQHCQGSAFNEGRQQVQDFSCLGRFKCCVSVSGHSSRSLFYVYRRHFL